ncbi:MAG: tRNA1(Val) (adenine(37)-N6)-methyltransferase [Clostridium sp.]|nr:tRNA1(Val) (adenine(37)-N6)-methyltransferase [Clostridium sp.]
MIDIKDDETLEDLGLKGLHIIQKKHGFRFGVDAVLLADFAKVRKKDTVIDFCTGTGIIPLLLYGKKEPQKITGVEIQKEFIEMAHKSVVYNVLEEKIIMVSGDLRNIEENKNRSKVDVVTVNPPSKKENSGILNEDDALTIARHEVTLNLEDVIKAAAYSLKDHGRFYMIHRPERLADIMILMRAYHIEPKELRMVYPKVNKPPTMILVEGRKGGNAFLKVLEPLFIYDLDGTYSDEIRRIYGDERR